VVTRRIVLIPLIVGVFYLPIPADRIRRNCGP
jgi:hypothetical protein